MTAIRTQLPDCWVQMFERTIRTARRGTERIRSTNRMRTLSTQPRKNPDKAPIVTPMIAERTATRSAVWMSFSIPLKTWAKMSWPMSVDTERVLQRRARH